MITLANISSLQTKYSVISKTKLRGNNSRPRYRLDKALNIRLSNGMNIHIPQGFIWDLSTTPRFLWAFFPPDGDYELAYLIHDYLWIMKEEMDVHFNYYDMTFSQRFTDKEMLRWAKVTNGTQKISYRNFDNWCRYIGVRAFGWLVWEGWIKITEKNINN